MTDFVSLEGAVELVNGKLMIRIPLAVGGDKLAPLARGFGETDGEFLNVVIQPWLAEKLCIEAGSLVFVDNENGMFTIRRKSASRGEQMTQLPDQMPEGCNFYALFQTELAPEDVAQRFEAAGWSLSKSGGASSLDIGWGRLILTSGNPVVLRGWLDRPDERVDYVLGLLTGSTLKRPAVVPGAVSSQWINAAGRLIREMPFEESMLDPDDPRLPADIKESMLADRAKAESAPQPRKPWWQFW